MKWTCFGVINSEFEFYHFLELNRALGLRFYSQSYGSLQIASYYLTASFLEISTLQLSAFSSV